jgi:hypothetical protein
LNCATAPTPGWRTESDAASHRIRPVPSRQFGINQAWLELALAGIDLLAWTRTLPLDGKHALAKPKTLRYRLLHVPARLASTAHRTIPSIVQTRRWADALVESWTAYAWRWASAAAGIA